MYFGIFYQPTPPIPYYRGAGAVVQSIGPASGRLDFLIAAATDQSR